MVYRWTTVGLKLAYRWTTGSLQEYGGLKEYRWTTGDLQVVYKTTDVLQDYRWTTGQQLDYRTCHCLFRTVK